jgi:uncharacterized glyoxalase superfamily protein PhnB
MNSAKAKSIPQGMNSVSPHLVCAGAAQAMDFYKKAFGAEEMVRLPGPDGKLMHGSMRVCGSSIMLVDEMPEWNVLGPKALGGSPVTIHLFVDDVDAVFNNAVAAGATVKMPVEDMFWGDRYGIVTDPFGHNWSIATHKRDVSREEMQAAIKQMAARGPQEARAS